MGEIRGTKIGWIGTGVMGYSMCSHLLAAGCSARVYNRTRTRAEGLRDLGAVLVDNPAQAAAEADFVFTIVGHPHDVREVYFGDNGILTSIREGALAVDCTTSEPSLAREISRALSGKKAGALDAPVSGGDSGAKNATLSVMVGGEEKDFARVLPFLEVMGKKIVHQGKAGAGQHAKLCNQIVVAGNMIGLCESLLYAYRAGLDPWTVLTSVTGGAANSWALENLGPRILHRDFNPGFFVEHFVKDMGIALKEAERLDLALPGLSLVHQLYLALRAQGSGRLGTQALYLALERLSESRPENL